MTFAFACVACVCSYLLGHLHGWKQAFKNVQASIDEGYLR